MQNFLMKMLDEKIPNLWSLMVQEYHILGFEGMIITLMVLAGEGLMKKFAVQKILLKVHQAVPTKDRHGIFWLAGFATLTLLSSISFAQSNPPAPPPPARGTRPDSSTDRWRARSPDGGHGARGRHRSVSPLRR